MAQRRDSPVFPHRRDALARGELAVGVVARNGIQPAARLRKLTPTVNFCKFL